MDQVPEARAIPESTLSTMLRRVCPEWELQVATASERGFCTVYHVVVGNDGARRELYVKASPDGRAYGVPTEARIQAVLHDRTSIPVPEVFGVVDDHHTLPSPYYVMAALDGAERPYGRVGRLDDGTLERLAKETGRYLGELHGVPAVENFGHVRHDGPSSAGDRPARDPDALSAGDPKEEWPAFLRVYAESELDRLADSRFSALEPSLRRWLVDYVDDLQGSFEAVLGRNDHGLHNLLVDPGSGGIAAMLDWGYTLAVPSAFDFEFAVYIYSGAFLAGLSGVPDRRGRVREAMLSGYGETAPDRVETLVDPDPCYRALATVRVANDFGALELPAGSEGEVADGIRQQLRSLFE
jgi:aminoglycoside phosphotransferase (APT) family kinase protein